MSSEQPAARHRHVSKLPAWHYSQQDFSHRYVGEGKAHSCMGHIILRFAGIRVIAHSQCKSAEYYLHRRPSLTVETLESNIISVRYDLNKMKKCTLHESSKLVLLFKSCSANVSHGVGAKKRNEGSGHIPNPTQPREGYHSATMFLLYILTS